MSPTRSAVGNSSVKRPREVRAALWPTYALDVRERWFDELLVWTEGFEPGTMRRARLQLDALRNVFTLLAHERVRKVGVTLSFGTVERCLELATDAFEENQLLCHRVVVLLRGDVARMRSPYRVRGFSDWLRSQQIPVGYRLVAPRVSMEMRAIDFLQPDFVRIDAPDSSRPEFWRDIALEVRAAGADPRWTIAAGLTSLPQRDLAREAGFGFGQGDALKPAYPLPAIRRAVAEAA